MDHAILRSYQQVLGGLDAEHKSVLSTIDAAASIAKRGGGIRSYDGTFIEVPKDTDLLIEVPFRWIDGHLTLLVPKVYFYLYDCHGTFDLVDVGLIPNIIGTLIGVRSHPKSGTDDEDPWYGNRLHDTHVRDILASNTFMMLPINLDRGSIIYRLEPSVAMAYNGAVRNSIYEPIEINDEKLVIFYDSIRRTVYASFISAMQAQSAEDLHGMTPLSMMGKYMYILADILYTTSKRSITVGEQISMINLFIKDYAEKIKVAFESSIPSGARRLQMRLQKTSCTGGEY